MTPLGFSEMTPLGFREKLKDVGIPCAWRHALPAPSVWPLYPPVWHSQRGLTARTKSLAIFPRNKGKAIHLRPRGPCSHLDTHAVQVSSKQLLKAGASRDMQVLGSQEHQIFEKDVHSRVQTKTQICLEPHFYMRYNWA